MLGGFKKTTKRNLLKGIPWRFGPNWPGKRCEAKTRKGTPCQRPAKLPVGRCRLHGGASTGPRTEEGLKRLADSKTKHGRFTKLNEKQLIAVHLLASGVKASVIAKKLGIREETLSRWKQIDEFKEALEDATEAILREIDETHKNLLISSQNVINEALNNEDLDLFKKASLALRYLSLIKGKDDITQKSSDNLFRHTL